MKHLVQDGIRNICFNPGTVDFEAVKNGLEKKSLTYIDVRNKSELHKEGSITGSVNIPCMENIINLT